MVLLVLAALAISFIACSDSDQQQSYMCNVYYGSSANALEPPAMTSVEAINDAAATSKCENDKMLQAQAMTATGSDELFCECGVSTD